jgi:hypothetical protein
VTSVFHVSRGCLKEQLIPQSRAHRVLDKIDANGGDPRSARSRSSRHTTRVDVVVHLRAKQESDAAIYGVRDLVAQASVGQKFEQSLNAGRGRSGSLCGIECAVESLIQEAPQLIHHQRLANLHGMLNQLFA